jgi:hypothetical protein
MEIVTVIAEWECKKCLFKTNKISNWKRHIQTSKHKKLHFMCTTCDKVFNNRQGLWRHKKKCTGPPILQQTTIINNDNTVNNNQTINNNLNLNINLILNEKCKDAMNLTDFVDQIKMTVEDLLYTKTNGYVKGISNVIIKNLKDVEPKERPICCTDEKKKQFYVKDEGKWDEDEGMEKLMKSWSKLTSAQLAMLGPWINKNPMWMTDPKLREEYHLLVEKFCKDPLIQANNDKIAEEISKVVSIDELKD